MKRHRFMFLMLLCAACSLMAVSCGGSDDPLSQDEIDQSILEQLESESDNADESGDDDASTDAESEEEVQDDASGDGITDSGYTYTISPWTGSKATDASLDVVDYSEADLYYEANNFTNTVNVSFEETSATVTTTNSDILYYTDGCNVTIDLLTNSVAETEIVLKGIAQDGQLKIYGEKKHKITLDGVSITSKRGPAINDQCHKRAFIHLAEGTTNILTDASTYTTEAYYHSTSSSDEDRKGALFSEGNLIFSGAGVLQVQGNYKHAIASDGYIYIRPGVTLAITGAAKNGIQANGDEDDDIGIYMKGGLVYADIAAAAGKGMKCDYNIEIAGGKVLITTTGDGTYDSSAQDTSSAACLKSDEDIVISGGTHTLTSTGSAGKGISVSGTFRIKGGTTTVTTTGSKYTYGSLSSSPKAIKADGNIYVTSGTLNVTASGSTSGTTGIDSKSSVYVTGGTVTANCYDNAVSASTSISITGGKLYACSTIDDGIFSKGNLTISGGLVIGCSASLSACGIYATNSSSFRFNGGTVIALGGNAVNEAPSNSTQCVAIYNSGIVVSSGDVVTLLSGGTPIVSFQSPITLSSAGVAFGTSSLISGSSYELSVGGTLSGYTDSWNGWYSGGSYSGGTQIATFTQSSTVTTVK